uniref:Uncharacterized protein n=1 Tax=Oryza punctata TaxID=4537 RepID=A0A0E0LCY9_ORYPU
MAPTSPTYRSSSKPPSIRSCHFELLRTTSGTLQFSPFSSGSQEGASWSGGDSGRSKERSESSSSENPSRWEVGGGGEGEEPPILQAHIRQRRHAIPRSPSPLSGGGGGMPFPRSPLWR